MKSLRSTAAVAVVAATASIAQGQRLQIDVNNVPFQARNQAGAPAPFNGVTHTGSVAFGFAAFSGVEGVLIQPAAGGLFEPQTAFNGALSSFNLVINLSNGLVTGGFLDVDLNGFPGPGGDRYAATLNAAGQVRPVAIGGFTIDSLSLNGTFSDADFRGVDVTPWFNAQGSNGFLTGDLLAFKINPNASGAGIGDVDTFTSVPSQGSLACLAVAGLVAARRRRSV
jgi:hypothetical protein